MLETFYKKCVIQENSLMGRYVVAKRDIRPGEVLLYESPIVISPDWEADLICSKCFRPSQTVCQKCQVFPLCFDCTEHCAFDCEFFEKIPESDKFPRNFLIENFAIYGPLKCLLLLENPANPTEFSTSFLRMESHLNERRSTSVYKDLQDSVVQPLIDSGIQKYLKYSKIVDTELIQVICGIFDVNAFEVRGPELLKSLKGLYSTSSMFAHNCVPNIMIAVDLNYEMKVYCTTPISKTDLIYYNYTNPLLGTVERQSQLKNGKYFECRCDRCEDPTELGTFMSAILCQTCSVGSAYYLYHKCIWICNVCGETLDNNKANELTDEAKKLVEKSQHNILEMELLVHRLLKVFHKNHYIVVDLKQNVASILRAVLNDANYTPSNSLLERKMQLCEEVLFVLRIVQPGISRLTGIALFEYFGPIFTLASLNRGQTTKDVYISELLRAQQYLRESVSMLLYEPPNTPEGQLAKSILNELHELKEIVKSAETTSA